MLGEKRRFQETMGEEAASASNAAKRLAPSGSLASPEPYAGSRRPNQRYEYSIKSKAAFVELHQDWYPPPNEGPQLFKELLEKVQGVDRVKWQPAPLKVMGVRGARGGGRAKPRTDFENHRGTKKSRSWRSRMVVVSGILSDCFIAFVIPGHGLFRGCPVVVWCLAFVIPGHVIPSNCLLGV